MKNTEKHLCQFPVDYNFKQAGMILLKAEWLQDY